MPRVASQTRPFPMIAGQGCKSVAGSVRPRLVNQKGAIMKMTSLAIAATSMAALPLTAHAQGILRGAEEGAAAGDQAAGPVGAVVGGSVGAAFGAAGAIL